MQVETQAHIAFHLTGRMPQGEGDALARSDLQPAIFAGYRDLTALRYDFPLVLMARRRRTTGAIAVRPVRRRAQGKSRPTATANACANMPAGSSAKSAS